MHEQDARKGDGQTANAEDLRLALDPEIGHRTQEGGGPDRSKGDVEDAQAIEAGLRLSGSRGSKFRAHDGRCKSRRRDEQ